MKLAALLMLLLCRFSDAQAEPSFASSLGANSVQLEAQLLATKTVESLLENDPNVLIEFAQSQTTAPITTPLALSLFHAFSQPTSNGVKRYLISRYGVDAFESTESGLRLLPKGAGLAVAALGTTLLLELISGDIKKYAHSEKERAKLTEYVMSVGAGFTASSAVSGFGAGVLVGIGLANPIGIGVLAFASGVTFFLTSDYYEKYATQSVLYGIEKKNLLGTLRALQFNLKQTPTGDVLSGKADDGFDQQIVMLGRAFTSLRSQIMSDILTAEQNFLRNSVRLQTQTYQLVKLAEWIRAGADPKAWDYVENNLNWTQAKMPYQESIEMALDPESRLRVTTQFIRRMMQNQARQLDEDQHVYQKTRAKLYAKLLDDPKLGDSYRLQLNILLGLVEPFHESQFFPELKRAHEILAENSGLLFHADELFAIFREVSDRFENEVKARMQPCYAKRLETLISALLTNSCEFRSHAHRTLFDEVVDKSIEVFQRVQNHS